MIADIEAAGARPHRRRVARSRRGQRRRTDVSDFDSVESLATSVFERYGACHLLFNNAGVTSGGGGLPWEQEPNDWKWCFGVNVFGVANGVLAFVPAHDRVGRAGRDREHVVGRRWHRAGAVRVGVRGEQGRDQLLHRVARAPVARHGPTLRAAVFYPSGGSARHRAVDRATQPAARARPRAGAHARAGADVRRVPRAARGRRARTPTSPTWRSSAGSWSPRSRTAAT